MGAEILDLATVPKSKSLGIESRRRMRQVALRHSDLRFLYSTSKATASRLTPPMVEVTTMAIVRAWSTPVLLLVVVASICVGVWDWE